MSDQEVLQTIADALDAASRVIKNRLALDRATNDRRSDPVDAVAKARAMHPKIGERQMEVVKLLEDAGDVGTSSGKLAASMKYDQPNVYLALESLAKLGFAEKDDSTRPHTYRLGEALRTEQ